MSEFFRTVNTNYTQAQILAGSANSLPAGITLVASDTAAEYTTRAGNVVPTRMADAALVTSTVAAGASIAVWTANTAYTAGSVVSSPVAIGGFVVRDLLRRLPAQSATSGATFDATEAAKWEELGAQVVHSVATRSGDVTLTSADVGLANVNNTTDANKPVSTAQATAIALKANIASPTFTGTVGGVTKAHVGLGNVDNTADSAKPVSTAQQTALDAKQATLVSGTTIRSVNGASLVGAGNVAVAADLPGGTATVVTDEGLGTAGSASVDTTTVPGMTIVRYIATSGTSFTAPLNVGAVDVLVVAGGGGGGYQQGGGGGGGGARDVAAVAVVPGTTYTVTVGAGGSGGTSSAAGTNGGNSVFSTVTSVGGGRGGNVSAAGAIGGSGGGSGTNGGAGVAGTLGQGFGGGAGLSTAPSGGGGGGGGSAAGSAKTAGTDDAANAGGGAGLTSAITGVATIYAGGGGGGKYFASTVAAAGGSGGGGAGGLSSVGVAGTAATGGGGGGGGQDASTLFAGAAGGSGVVVVRFATQSRTYQALAAHADNATAVAAGLLVGQFYRLTATGAVTQVV